MRNNTENLLLIKSYYHFNQTIVITFFFLIIDLKYKNNPKQNILFLRNKTLFY